MAYGLDSGTVQILIAAKDATAAAFATVNARMKTLEVTAARVRTAVASVAKATALIGAAATIGGIYASTKAFMDFEDALAGVRKTTGMTKGEIDALGQSLTDLSTTKLPMARTELAAIAAVAGQLGIQGKDNILSFTESVAMMSVAFDMSAEDAATAMAKLGEIYAIPIAQTENLASAINILGNTTAAKEREIIAFSMALGPVAEQLGFTATQTLALGATLIEIGMDASDAGTRLNRAFSMIGQNLNELASFMGVTTEEFKRSFENMPLDTFTAILQKLSEVEGSLETNIIASELFNEVGAKGIKGFLGNLDGLATNLKNSENAFHENTAVAEEFATKTDTLTAKWQIFKNEVIAAFGKLGALMAPTLDALIATFKDAVPVLLEYIMSLKNELAPAIENVKEVFESVKGILRGLFGTDAENELSAFATIVTKLTEIMKRFFDILDKNPALVKFAIAVTAATVALSYAVPAVMGLYTALTFLYAHPVILTLAAITAALVYLEVEFGLVTNTTAQFGRGLTELKGKLEPVITGLNELRDRLPELTARFGFITDAIGSAVTELKKLYDMLPDVAKRVLGLARDLVELKASFMFGGPLGAIAKRIYDLGDNVEDTGNKSEKAGKQIELTKDELQEFITEIEASTPAIQEYKDAVETTATALKTWTTAQLASQQAQLALSEPKAALTELNKLLTESTGLEQELAAVVAESQAIWDEANTAKVTTEEKVAEITRKLTDLVKARAQAEEDAAAKIARIAQNEISAKAGIERANVSLLQSQRALISALEDYDDLTRSLAGAELSVEGAEIAVEKARLAYEQIGKGWSPIEIGFSFPGTTSMDPFAERDALLALERAELELANAQDTRADTQERLNALKGAEEIKGVIAAYKGISAEEFESTFYVGGQLDIESLKESITDEDAAIISERIKNLLPDMDLGTGIESTISAITSYEDDILTLEEKLTGYTQDRLDVTEDLHDELESLYEDQIEWEGGLEDAIGARDRATGDLEDAERELGKISKYYADIVKVADNDRLTRAKILYDAIKENETDYNTLLASTGKTYNGLETDVKDLQTVVDTAVTAEKTAQVEYNIELANTKTLLENDMVAAWNTLTQHLESTPANATISLPDIEDLFTPFLVSIQKLADDNPIKIALDWSEGSPFWESGVEGVDYHPPPATEEEPASGWWSHWGYSSEEEAKKGGVRYNPETGEAYRDKTGGQYEEIYGAPGETTAPVEGPKHKAWRESLELYESALAKSLDMTKSDAYRLIWAGKAANYSGALNKVEPVFTAHTGGETLKEGLIEVERGEWIFPRDVVAQFKELLTLPSLAPAVQTVTNTISVHIDTINNKSDADYLISKLERKFNQRALL
jgi:TP901 family phage tail tape measure protein